MNKKQFRMEAGKTTLYREVTFSVDAVREADEDGSRTVEISFSSENPVDRWYGTEILDHKKGAVRLERLKNGAAVLVHHRMDDHVGVVEKAWIEDRRGKAIIRFGKGARASEIWQDVVDGIRKHTSVGYVVHAWEESKKDGHTTYRITDWEPLEPSIVAIPADVTVGVGRSAEEPPEAPGSRAQKENAMPPEEAVVETRVAAESSAPAPPEVDVEKIKSLTRKEELERVRSILELGARFSGKVEDATVHAETFARDGKSTEAFRQFMLEELGKSDTPQTSVGSDGLRRLGLNDKDRDRFSFMRLGNYLLSPTREAEKSAGFELEACDQWAKRAGVSPSESGRVLPPELFYDGAFLRNSGVLPRSMQKRLVSDTTEGEDMTPVMHDAASFVDLLRAATPVTEMAMLLTGLDGDVLIPKQTSGATAGYAGESSALSEQTPTYGQMKLDPKRLGAWIEVTRRAMIQMNPSIEDLLRLDLLIAVAQRVELAAIQGGGANEPTGILGTAGIGDVDLGVNGGAMTWPKAVEYETDVDTANALVSNMGYVTTPGAVGHFKTTEITAGYPKFLMQDGQMNGYPVHRTTNVPSNLTKGSGTNLHAVLFGDWAQLIIAFWDTLELIVNPFSKDTQGIVRLTIQHENDLLVRREQSFSISNELDVAA